MSQHPDGLYGMWCFEALSAEQQRQVVEDGFLPFGWMPEGDGCDRPADVEVTTRWDRYPGPRFFCARHAVTYLCVTELSNTQPPGRA